MKNTLKLILLSVFIYSCKSAKVSVPSAKSFALLNKIEYASNNLSNELKNSKTLSESLNVNEIEFLENFSKKHPLLTNFNNAECMGCNTSFSSFKPIYKVKKGRYIHFGLKSGLGIKHVTFKKNGNFISQLYAFQGYSKLRLKEVKKQGKKYNVITAIYPVNLTKKGIYLDHFEYTNQNDYDNWYKTLLPLHFKLFVNFKDKKPETRFIFNSGLYSIQDLGANNKYRTINFFEPTFSLDSNNKHKSTLINGYTSTASFYLINIEKNSEVEITINSNLKNESFLFSIFNNTKYLTLNEYLTIDKPLLNNFKKILKKGSYLIRVKNKYNGKIDDNNIPYYTIKVSKSIK
ncbi:MAG: hypothetical protein L3J08_05690 [Flavobacteriaceae bacterium]|nr:hypothetical protein [Flavobacteriaceae bacterium]